MKLKDLKKYKLSNTPGVYFFLKGEKVLYIGKATSLKDRVKSYFNKDLIGMRGPIILDMVFQADKIKWEKTDSVLEALILEAELIKKNQPKYNTKEKSDKSFNYVCITDEEIPKVLIIRGRELVQKKYENFSSLTLPRVRGGPLRVKNFHIPRELFRIEAYDVAHMSGRNMVGVMTVIEDGEVNKNEYRKFKINTQSGANDTGALAEIINRRLMHTEWQYPNLMVVDGGKAQINTVEKIFKIAGIEIPVVSVLKDENHKPKNILGRHDLAVKYEQEILLANSEAHRFAITYHKQMRGKNFLK